MRNGSIIVGCIITLSFTIFAHAATPPQPITLQLNWVPNVEFAGVLLAKEKGWYAEAGIDLTINAWKEDISSVDEVAAGRAQFGIVEGADVLKARAAGKPLKAIAAVFQKSAVCLISKTEAGIDSPEKLRGKRIGINDQASVTMLKIMLKSVGVPYEEITPVQVGWDTAQSLIDGKVDATVGYMNSEPLILKEQGYSVSYLPAFKYGYDFYIGVYIVTEEMLRTQPEVVQRFLEVTLQGWKEAFTNPEAAAKIVFDAYQPAGSVQQQIEELNLFRMLATLGEGKKFLGWMEERIWQKGIETLSESQQIDRTIPAQDVFTMEFLDKIYFNK